MSDYFITFGSHLRYGWNFILSNVILCFCISFLFNDKSFKGWKNLLIHLLDFLVTYGVHLLFNSLAYVLVGEIYMGILSWPMLILLHAFLMNRLNLYDRLMKAMTITSFTLMIFPLTSAIGVSLKIWNESIFIVAPFVLGYTFFIRRFSLEEFRTTNLACFISEVIVFLCTLSVLITCNIIGMGTIPVIFQIVLFFALYVISGVICFIYYMVAKEERKALDNYALAFKSKNDYEMVKLTTDNMESLRKMRHDMRAQYQYMQILLKNRDYDSLDKFFSDMCEDSFAPLNFVNCGNNAVSGVMNNAIRKAQEFNIGIDHMLLVPEHLDISDFELVRYLSNILDNAIEATWRDHIENAMIRVRITYKEPTLLVHVENPISADISPEERLSLTTSKNDRNLHGYGKKIIKEISDRYHGTLVYKIEDGKFIFSSMLRLERKED